MTGEVEHKHRWPSGPELEADSSLPARFWLAADIGCCRCKVKLPVLLQMTTRTEPNKENIRANGNNVFELLGFLRRIVLGVDGREWVN
jgi:hypothetical protein